MKNFQKVSTVGLNPIFIRQYANIVHWTQNAREQDEENEPRKKKMQLYEIDFLNIIWNEKKAKLWLFFI